MRSPRYSLIRAKNGAWGVRCVRRWSDETQPIPDDEAGWCANKPSRMAELFWWHRDFGLARRVPHPMGKDLVTLQNASNAAHAERYTKAGMEVPGCYLQRADRRASKPRVRGPREAAAGRA